MPDQRKSIKSHRHGHHYGHRHTHRHGHNYYPVTHGQMVSHLSTNHYHS